MGEHPLTVHQDTTIYPGQHQQEEDDKDGKEDDDDVLDDYSSSNHDLYRQLQKDVNGDSDLPKSARDGNPDMSVIGFQNLYKLQDMYYALEMQENITTDDIISIKRHVKKLYRNVKFFSDSGHDFDEPSFAYAMASAPGGSDPSLYKQTIQIAEILMKEKEPTRIFNLKTKIFWWKGYRDTVRREFNRLRQAEVRAFQTRFVEGMIMFCLIYILFLITNTLYILQINFFYLAFKKNYKEAVPEMTTESSTGGVVVAHKNEMKLLLDLYASCPEGKFATSLLDQRNVDMNLFKFILDIAMPAIVKLNYENSAAFDKLSEHVTLSEEAFAFLVLENLLDRWVFIAKREYVESGNKLQGIDLGKEDQFKFDKLPGSKYQLNSRTKKNPSFLGRWTSSGFAQYNELLAKVKDERDKRTDFESKLVAMYKEVYYESPQSKGYNKTTPFEGKVAKDEKLTTVMVMNVLTFKN